MSSWIDKDTGKEHFIDAETGYEFASNAPDQSPVASSSMLAFLVFAFFSAALLLFTVLYFKVTGLQGLLTLVGISTVLASLFYKEIVDFIFMQPEPETKPVKTYHHVTHQHKRAGSDFNDWLESRS